MRWPSAPHRCAPSPPADACHSRRVFDLRAPSAAGPPGASRGKRWEAATRNAIRRAAHRSGRRGEARSDSSHPPGDVPTASMSPEHPLGPSRREVCASGTAQRRPANPASSPDRLARQLDARREWPARWSRGPPPAAAGLPSAESAPGRPARSLSPRRGRSSRAAAE